MIWASLLGLYVGIVCTRKCTWSRSVLISRNVMSYRAAISRQTSRRAVSSGAENTARRYFAGQTRWYSRMETLWLRWMCLLIPPAYHTDRTRQAAGYRPSTNEVAPVDFIRA